MNPSTTDISEESHFTARLSLYCFAHFLIDLASTCLLIGYIWNTYYDLTAYVWFYGIAFGGQMPLGLLADKLNRNGLVASLGCLLMILAYVLMYVDNGSCYYSVVVFGGLANALVHVGGGIDVINHCGSKSGPLGIFVSPGCIGLFLGVALVNNNIEIPVLILSVLAITAIAIPVVQKYSLGSLKSQNVPLSLRTSLPNTPKLFIAAAIASLFIVVCIRSYIGLTSNFEWKSQWHWGIILLIALVAGKSLGGVLSDRFGMRRVAIVSLCAAAILYAFPRNPWAGSFAVFLFNMTMPMTLWALSRIFDHARGFAFGTLTVSLFLGFLITVFYPEPIIPMGLGFSMATLLSLALLYIGIRPLNQS